MATVYIAGPITGDPDYKQKFDAVTKKLREFNLETVNPTDAPEGLTYRQYINRGLEKLSKCDLICMLPYSDQSPGARLERIYARTVGMPILEAKLSEGEWLIT